jgi:hypothetical protein
MPTALFLRRGRTSKEFVTLERSAANFLDLTIVSILTDEQDAMTVGVSFRCLVPSWYSEKWPLNSHRSRLKKRVIDPEKRGQGRRDEGVLLETHSALWCIRMVEVMASRVQK